MGTPKGFIGILHSCGEVQGSPAMVKSSGQKMLRGHLTVWALCC